GVDRASDALGLAERVRAVVGRPVPLPGRVVTVTASVGVALGAGHQTATLLDEADLALYRAKGDGRDRVRLYRHDMGRRGAGGLEREAVLRGALEDGGLTATFQPVVELASGTVVGAQARLSLRGAGELAASPHLVDSAERSGLSVSLGAGLLDLACQQLAASSDDGTYTVAVAVSPRQLADPRLPALVDATRRAHGLPAHRLCLDISERTVTDLPPGGKQMLAQLLALGVSLAVDDFGSDPSGAGLRALQDVGISVLKIDEAFVAGIGRQRSDTEVVRAFVRLGLSMGTVTVAKGVTTAEQVEFLTELGCRLGVGPYFGDPAPASFSRRR
ncbi:MAG: EAL domain-containing protein, partial [Actinomycetes bacterium]